MCDLDAELMVRAAQGDSAAFKELFDRHYPRAVNIAYRTLGDRDASEDIAMDAFAKIYETRTRYRPTARFTTFLYRIVVNLSLNAARRASRIACEPLDEARMSAPDSSDPAEALQQAHKSNEVREAVLALPGKQRMALILTRYEEMSYQEAAEAMGTSAKAVESLLQRARRNLRRALGLED